MERRREFQTTGRSREDDDEDEYDFDYANISSKNARIVAHERAAAFAL